MEMHLDYNDDNRYNLTPTSRSFTNKKLPFRKIIIFGQIISVVILSIVILVMLIIKNKQLSTRTTKTNQDNETNQLMNYIDQLMIKNHDFLTKLSSSSGNEQPIWMSWNLRMLDGLYLNESEWYNCYPMDSRSLYYHYCEDEARYPVIFDKNCFPHSIDLYEKLLIYNETALDIDLNQLEFAQRFIEFFKTFLKDSDRLWKRTKFEIDQAFEFSEKIGQDCEHPEVWHKNFDLTFASGRNDHELWELYCERSIRYPNLVSRISGKYYVPGYYDQRLQQASGSDKNRTKALAPNEQWMLPWMINKFLPLYKHSKTLQKRFQTELKQSKNYAKRKGLQCKNNFD